MCARTATRQRLLPCETGGEIFCLDMSWVQSVERSQLLGPDETGQEPLGRLSLDGREEIAVHSLAARLGWPQSPLSRSGRILVLETDRGRWGLLLDRVLRALEIDGERIFPLPALAGRWARTAIAGVVALDDRLAFYFRPQALIDDAAAETARPEHDEGRPRPPARRLAAAPAVTANGSGRMVLFSTPHARALDRSVVFGLSLRQVVEIHELPALTRVPRAPADVLGLASWRGRPFAVLDLDRRLGWPESRDGVRRLIVARAAGGELVGLPVSAEIRIVRLPIAHRFGTLPFEPGLLPTRGVFELEHETLVIPDLEALARPEEGRT